MSVVEEIFSTIMPRKPVATPQAVIEDLEVYSVETFPVQIHAVVQGHLPDTCTQLTGITEEISGVIISLKFKFERRDGPACVATPVPFEEIVPLSVTGLPAGGYMVQADGRQALFELLVDNTPGKPVWEQ